MSNLPSLDDATNRVKSTVQSSKSSVLWWIPDPIPCDKCGLQCEASRAYDPHTAAFHAEHNGKVPTWYCENCDTHYRREER